MPRNLLLADDSITIQKVIGITFAGEGFTIIAVDNGEDAVRKARELRPDVILADVVMPRKNGYEVCETIKSDPELAHIPVLLLAGTFEAFDEARARSARADGHIAKPFESQALINKVRELLQKSTTQPSTDRTTPPSPVAPSRPVPPAPSIPSPPRRAQEEAGSSAARVVPPVLLRQGPGPASSTPAAGVGGTSSTRGPAPERGGASDLDWAALGFETDAAAQSRNAGLRTPPTRTASAPPSTPIDVPPAPSTPIDVPPARTQEPRQGGAPAAAVQTSTQRTAAAVPLASPELLPFGEPIDLADLEVVDSGEDSGNLTSAPSSMPQPDGGSTEAEQRTGWRAEPAGLDAGRRIPSGPEAISVRPEPSRSEGDAGEARLREALSHASRDVIEKIAWEVIPTLAEAIIREHVERLVKEREK